MPTDLDLLTAGRVNLDLYAQQTGAEFADVRGFDGMVGGSPTNIAVAAARLGLRTAVFTGVGDDVVGDWVLRSLEREGVDTSYVARKGARRTSLALLAQLPPDRFPRIFYRDDPADIHLTVEEARHLPLASTPVVLVSGDVFARGSTAEACAWILRNAAPSTTVYVDLDLRPENWPSLDAYAAAVRPMIEHADVVLGTVEEFAALGDELELSPGRVLIQKRGADGATLIVDGDRLDVPAQPVSVASTVGAGDSFAAGVIAARLRGDDWDDAARFANACAAVTVGRSGCSDGFPTLAEVVAGAR